MEGITLVAAYHYLHHCEEGTVVCVGVCVDQPQQQPFYSPTSGGSGGISSLYHHPEGITIRTKATNFCVVVIVNCQPVDCTCLYFLCVFSFVFPVGAFSRTDILKTTLGLQWQEKERRCIMRKKRTKIIVSQVP